MNQVCIALSTAVMASATCTSLAAERGAHLVCDFNEKVGPVRPELHSASYSPRLFPRALMPAGMREEDSIRQMNLHATRTHDWALSSQGQRIIDTHFIFPLMKLDPKDETNYYFDATDEAIRLARENAGLDIFYRLGTSIEHTLEKHFNILIPEDYDKYAEVCAGIVRHYNRGWANGHKWNIKYWEIWNEPDGTRNCWAGDGVGAGTVRDDFIRLFVTVLKRLKSEFGDEIMVGGPALCHWRPDEFEKLLAACKKEGILPDFISWHYYGNSPDKLASEPDTVRKWLDERGYKSVQTCINEWHFAEMWNGLHGASSPEAIKKAHSGPDGIDGADGVAFTMYVLNKFQYTSLWQSYFYGAGYDGNWGYMDKATGLRNRTYWTLRAFGALVATGKDLVRVNGEAPNRYNACAAISEEGKTAAVTVADYRDYDGITLTIRMKGFEDAKRIEVSIIDQEHNLTPVDCAFEDGYIVLRKNELGSAAWLINLYR